MATETSRKKGIHEQHRHQQSEEQISQISQGIRVRSEHLIQQKSEDKIELISRSKLKNWTTKAK